MKKIFILIFLLFLIAPVYAENATITIVSDIYLNSDKKDNKMTPSIRSLLKFVEQTNQYNSDYVVFLGNNLKSANKIDLVMFAKIINRLKAPFFVTVGNNDLSKTKGMVHKEYYRVLNKFSNNKTKELPFYKKEGDLVFVFLSGANESFATYNGYYKTPELEFLDKTLTKFKEKKVIIFQHFPIVPPAVDEARQTYKTENYFDVLSRHDNVLAIVSGHYQKEAMLEENGIKHISVAGFGKTGEYEQIKIFQNKDGSYSITARILNIN